MYALLSLPIGMNCVAAERGIVFRAWPCATHFFIEEDVYEKVSRYCLGFLVDGASVWL